MDKFNPSDYNRYSELPEEEKRNFRRIAKGEAFVSKEALRSEKLAHQVALIEDQALGVVEAALAKQEMPLTEAMAKMDDKTLDYQQKNLLKEQLYQSIDVQSVRGQEIDSKILEQLKKTYDNSQHSKAYCETVEKLLVDGDVKAIAFFLKDPLYRMDYSLISKLKTDKQRGKAIDLLVTEGKLDKVSSILQKISDWQVALSYYTELKSKLGKYEKERCGEHIAKLLIKENCLVELLDGVSSGLLEVSFFSKKLYKFEDDQKFLLKLAQACSQGDDLGKVLKYVGSANEIVKMMEGAGWYKNEKMEEENRKDGRVTVGNSFVEALRNDPEIVNLTDSLAFDGRLDDSQHRLPEAQNKFVVGIREKSYCFAFGQMVDGLRYHSDMFNKLRYGKHLEFGSGGYISMTEEGDKTVVTLTRNSSDFGCYSKKVLDNFYKQIKKSIEDMIGKQIDFKIEKSVDPMDY